uniref:Uncharacterized protein n=1 Tax=Sphaerodactylus townsendi TaxID=933632 RepID=A0ACB8FS29_9SAUR
MRSAGHVRVAYARWGRVQMADAEADAALAPEMQRVSAGLRARLWQLQAELSDQEVAAASSGAFCRGFCQAELGCLKVEVAFSGWQRRPKSLDQDRLGRPGIEPGPSCVRNSCPPDELSGHVLKDH